MKNKIPTTIIGTRIPDTWLIELAAIAAYRTKKKGKLIRVQDLIRIAIVKTYFMSKDEILPDYPSYRPLKFSAPEPD